MDALSERGKLHDTSHITHHTLCMHATGPLYFIYDSIWLSGVGGTGTVRQNRLHHVPLPGRKEAEREERGTINSVYTDDKVIVSWRDSKAVFLVSNVHNVNPITNCRRWSRSDKKRIRISQPNVICEYNQFMNGCDMLDQIVGYYRPRIRVRKWWWALYSWSLAVSTVNAWRLYQHTTGDKKFPYLQFLRNVYVTMVIYYNGVMLWQGHCVLKSFSSMFSFIFNIIHSIYLLTRTKPNIHIYRYLRI